MGPNGQAQYFARDLGDACRILLQHYDHTYVAPGERFPRRADASDPTDRDVCASVHGGEFETVGEVFSMDANPDRKRPFDIRRVMAASPTGRLDAPVVFEMARDAAERGSSELSAIFQSG